MVVADYYQILFGALCKRDMNELAKAACEILHMPIVVTDTAFIVRAKYPDTILDDEQWDANTMNRQIEPRFVKTFIDDDHFAHHEQAGRTILADWGHYAEAPRLTSIVRSGDIALGYFSALATGVEIEPWHYDAADAITDAFAMLMEAGVTAQLAMSGLTSPALYSLLDGTMEANVALNLLPPEFFGQNKSPYILLCIRTRNPYNSPLEMYLGNMLVRHFEHAIQTVYDGDLYILASEISADARNSVRAQVFVDELDKQDLYCGASRIFGDLDEVRSRAWEASSALGVGMALALEGPLFHYEDLIIEAVCHTLWEHVPEGALEEEGIATLRRHDEENGTAYLETFQAFFDAEFDKKRTSEKLHIHRNTLQYRLDRIKQMLGKDIDGTLYALSFAMGDYKRRLREAEGTSKFSRS